jgi:hypothetical protein
MNKKIAVIFTLLLSASPMLMAEQSGQLPSDFNHKEYLDLNQDLRTYAKSKNLDEKSFAEEHYVNHGKSENRHYKPTQSIKDKLPKDFDWRKYLVLNPDLRQHLAQHPNLQSQTFAEEHYVNHGKAEGRKYKVDEPVVPNDFNAAHYLALNPDVKLMADQKHIVGQQTLLAFAKQHYSQIGKAQGKFYNIADLSKKVETAEKATSHTAESLDALSQDIEIVLVIKDLNPSQKTAVEDLHNRVIRLMFKTPGATRL